MWEALTLKVHKIRCLPVHGDFIGQIFLGAVKSASRDKSRHDVSIGNRHLVTSSRALAIEWKQKVLGDSDEEKKSPLGVECNLCGHLSYSVPD